MVGPVIRHQRLRTWIVIEYFIWSENNWTVTISQANQTNQSEPVISTLTGLEKAVVEEEESEEGASVASEDQNEVLNNSLVKNLEKDIAT